MHSPFPWSTHPQMPTCVYNADGMKISEAIGPDAEDNAALIAAIPALVAEIEKVSGGGYDSLKEAMDGARSVLALIGGNK